MKLFVSVCAALVAVALASDDYKDNSYGTYNYYGKYEGKCGNDGLYFRDEKSFVFCSNGNSYVQPCAPGTRNSGYEKYSYGGKYDYRDFCDVNLVDDGYAAKYPAKAPAKPVKYEEPAKPAYDDGYYGYDRAYDYGRRDYGYGRRDYGYGRRDYYGPY